MTGGAVDHDPISRRSALALGVGAAAAISVPGCVAPATSQDPSDPCPGLSQFGAAYLARTPGEDSRALLQQLLGGADPATPPDLLLTTLAAVIAAELAGSTTVSIDGWYLSVTQCRIAAFWAKRDEDD